MKRDRLIDLAVWKVASMRAARKGFRPMAVIRGWHATPPSLRRVRAIQLAFLQLAK